MLKREIKLTQDGSKTLYIPEWNESYHSKHGALVEAEHVFIRNGLDNFLNLSTINILEFGFGTGLNALLSNLWSHKHSKYINYATIEKFPISPLEITLMQYDSILAQTYPELKADTIYDFFLKLHKAPWELGVHLNENVALHKIKSDFRDVKLQPESYDIVFFDAFGMRVQPELWSLSIFENIYQSLKPNGLLTTYACNGHTKRTLSACGFTVKKLPGPPGKREMINAWKN